MSLAELPLCLREELDLLEPAWMAGGQRNLRSLKSLKCRKIEKSVEVESVDIIAGCKKVQGLMRYTQGMRQQRHQAPSQVRTKIEDSLSFRDIARLSFGLCNIYNQQVSNLLGYAEDLLNQMKNTGNIFKSPPEKNRKRKITITKQTKITLTKKIRVEESEEPLENTCSSEYTNMLTECLEWSNIELSTEFARMSQLTNTTEQNITIQDVVHNESSRDFSRLPDEDEGFGEPTPDDINLNLMEQLFPNKSLKRPAQDNPSDLLCIKKSRADTKLEQTITDTAISHNSSQMSSDCEMNSHLDLIPESIMSPPRQQNLLRKKKPKHSKLIIDKRKKFGRQELLEHRAHYRQQLLAAHNRPKIPKISRTADQLLNCTNSGKIQHKHLAKTRMRSRDNGVQESTLRAIFGSDYSDVLAKDICQKLRPQSSTESFLPKLSSTNVEEEREELIPPVLPPILPVPQETSTTLSPKNNNSYYLEKDHINLDSVLESAYNVMMMLLGIWRKDPEVKDIDVNQFLQSWQRRTQVALVFYYLLGLSRDGYIQITKRRNSLQMYKILMGLESIHLIMDVTLEVSE